MVEFKKCRVWWWYQVFAVKQYRPSIKNKGCEIVFINISQGFLEENLSENIQCGLLKPWIKSSSE